MHKAILCFGSNMPRQEAESLIAEALNRMEEHALLAATSEVYPSSSGYENLVAEMESDMPYSDMLALTKAIEAALGRTPEMKHQGIVPIDIDIVYFDGEPLRPTDIAAAYFKRGMASMRPASCKQLAKHV